MKRFAFLYFFFLALLFALLYPDFSPLAVTVNEQQTGLTLYLLDLCLPTGMLNGIDILINPHYKIIITKACNGIIPVLFLFASLLAYPAFLRHKALWMLIGYTALTLINTGRILLVVYIVHNYNGKEDFSWAHDFIGNFILLVSGLTLFLMFIHTTSRAMADKKEP